MAPLVCETAVATPSEPLTPLPPGAVHFLPPSNVHTSGAVAVRYLVKLSVVPESSLRWYVWIAVDGRVASGLSALIAASSHVLTLPAKISAIVFGESCRLSTPLTL